MKPQKINSAGRLAEWFVTSRLTLLFVIACALLGAMVALVMPRDENPQIIIPSAEIVVQLPGASPQEVEEQVIRPLEGIVRGISGIDHTYASALDSVAVLGVQFKVGEDKEKSLVKLYDRVLAQRGRLPPDASAPVIRSVDVDDVPIVAVTLTSEKYDDHALKLMADRLVEGLRSLDAVSTAYVKGGRDRSLRIELDPARLQAFGATLEQVRLALAASNVSAPLGVVVAQGQSRPLALEGFVTSAYELEQLLIGQHQGRPIYLVDVAKVVDGPPEAREKLSRSAFGPADSRFGSTQEPEVAAVTVAVGKKGGTNAVTVADEVLERISRMQTQWLPPGVELLVTRNDGQKAIDSVKLLFEHFVLSVLVVFVVCVVFLGLKEALIVVLTVPLVVSLTLSIGLGLGLSINRITLFAIILSLGLLVDAAIVVIENIHRKSAAAGGMDSRALMVAATNEIGNPTNLATLAVMLVFGSLLVMGGIMGQYFRGIAILVPVAMAASLLVAYVVVPWAARHWLGEASHTHTAEAGSGRIERVYRRLLVPVLDAPACRRGLFVLVALTLVLSFLQPAWQFIRPSGMTGPTSWLGVAMGMLVKDNKNTFTISIDLPASAPLETTDSLTREIGNLLRSQPTVLNYQSWVGETGVLDFNALMRGTSGKRGANVAEIRVNLSDKGVRDKTSIDIVRELRPLLAAVAARYTGSTVLLVEEPPGPPVRATVLAEIYATDLGQLREAAQRVEAQVRKTYDIVDVTNSEAVDVPQIRWVVDRDKAALSGVTVAEVAQALARWSSGETLGRAHLPGERHPVPIQLQVPRRFQTDVAGLSGVSLNNRAGQRVALSELVRAVSGVQARPIQHKDGERVAYVGADLGSTSSFYAVLDLDRRIDGMALANGQTISTGNMRFNPVVPDTINGVRLLWDGEQRVAMSVYRDMLMALGVAVLLIFLMLVAYYQAFDLPLVVMAAIPLSLIGVFPGHWLLGQTFSSTSMVGVIALAGIVVRNALLIIDFTLDYLRHGLVLRDAIEQACLVRLRPIVLTALAIMLGSAVMLRDPVFSGLAISMIFGTLASTVLAMLVIPAILYLFLRRREGVSGAAHFSAPLKNQVATS